MSNSSHQQALRPSTAKWFKAIGYRSTSGERHVGPLQWRSNNWHCASIWTGHFSQIAGLRNHSTTKKSKPSRCWLTQLLYVSLLNLSITWYTPLQKENMIIWSCIIQFWHGYTSTALLYHFKPPPLCVVLRLPYEGSIPLTSCVMYNKEKDEIKKDPHYHWDLVQKLISHLGPFYCPDRDPLDYTHGRI